MSMWEKIKVVMGISDEDEGEFEDYHETDDEEIGRAHV